MTQYFMKKNETKVNKTKKNHPIILCGDWNLVQVFSLDKFGYQRENNTKAKKKVLEMQAALELKDIWENK